MTQEDKQLKIEVGMENRRNPSIEENYTNIERKSRIVGMFSSAQLRLLKEMSKEEIHYMLESCRINDYIGHLKSRELSSAFPVLLVKGDAVQLEKYKLLLLLKNMDLSRTVKCYYPSDFDIKSPLITGEGGAEKIVDNPNIVFVCVKKGSSTTDGMDGWRAKLISTVIAQRRDTKLFTVVLFEEPVVYEAFNNGIYETVELDRTKCTPQEHSSVNTSNKSNKSSSNTNSSSNINSSTGKLDMYGNTNR